MVGRTQSVKFPDGTGQNAIAELIAFPPPAIPNPAQITVRAFLGAGQFRRQQTAETKKPGLQRKGRVRVAQPARAQFGKILHGPDVVFVAERAEQAFPQRLLPAGVPGAGAELFRLAWKRTRGGGVQNPALPRFIQFAQGHAALAAQFFGQVARRIIFQPQAQFGDGGIESIAQGQTCWRSGSEFRLQATFVAGTA